MATSNRPGQVPSKALQPPVKFIDNPPAASVAQALANAAKVVDAAKQKAA